MTAADGTFTLAAREAGFWTLRAEAAGDAARELDLLPLVEERDLEAVELARERPLEVAVVGPDGKPVAGAWGRGGGAERRPALPRRRDVAIAAAAPPPDRAGAGRGVARRGGAPDRRAFAPGFHEAELEVAAARKSATLALAAAGPPVPIEVRDAAGRPVAGALVVGGKGRWPLGTTGGNGRLSRRRPAPRARRCTPWPPAGARPSARLRAPEPNRPAALFTLADAGPLSGRVLDADRREPLAGALVWIGEDPDGAARTDRAGSYRVAAVPAGTRGGLAPPPRATCRRGRAHRAAPARSAGRPSRCGPPCGCAGAWWTPP